uniref:Uncharacterized protein n=1 Tax=Arundo donax TaxID=35708 RepID=A0A0A9AM41_ARUDO
MNRPLKHLKLIKRMLRPWQLFSKITRPKHLLLPALRAWPLAGSWHSSPHPVQLEMLSLQPNWPVDWTCLHLTACTTRRTGKLSRMQATTLGRAPKLMVQ